MSSNVSVSRSLKDGHIKLDSSKRHSKHSDVSLLCFDLIKERPNQSMDFLERLQEPSSVVLPLESQESAIIGDLLTCFLGRNGDFIVANPINEIYEQRTFTISSSISDKLAQAATRSLILASQYSMAIRFVQRNRSLDSGRVNQALASAIYTIIECYYININNLEDDISKRNMNIQMFHHSIQPLLETMSFLATISEKILRKESRGGKTLSILHGFYSSTYSGSTNHIVALKLLTQSSKPFLESVKQWIFRGVIFDPFNEFMIFENPKVNLQTGKQQDYWIKKYQIRHSCVPKFLEKVTDQILNSGKYLMVASNCARGEAQSFLPENELIYTPDEDYISVIENAYKFSSKYLFNIILNDYNIVERMKSVKRYFLLQQGDFITTIFDLCGEELSKLISEIIPSRFAALVDVAVRVQSTNDDPYRESISLSLKPVSIIEQLVKLLKINTPQEFVNTNSGNVLLSGIDAFALSLKTEWPISLIFNQKIINYYQMFFRHIIYVKYIEMLLFKVWLYDMTLEKKVNNDYHLNSFGLRHKMISFVQNMAYYMLEEIVEPYWSEMITKVPNLESVDALLKEHMIFIDKCLQDCLLKDIALFHNFRSILTTCKNFSEYISQYEKKPNEISSTNFTNTIHSMEKRFDEDLRKFLQRISNEVTRENNKIKMFSILHRFDAIAFAENSSK